MEPERTRPLPAGRGFLWAYAEYSGTGEPNTETRAWDEQESGDCLTGTSTWAGTRDRTHSDFTCLTPCGPQGEPAWDTRVGKANHIHAAPESLPLKFIDTEAHRLKESPKRVRLERKCVAPSDSLRLRARAPPGGLQDAPRQLQEADAGSKLDAITYPVTPLHAHGDAVIKFQPGDVAEPEDDPGTVRPADALSQLTNVSFGALPVVEVAEVSCVEEKVCSEKFSKAALARPERERGVQVQAAGPVGFSTQVVAFALWPNAVHAEPAHTRRSPEVEPISDTGRFITDGDQHSTPERC